MEDTMAKIREFTKGTGNISARISEVECVYNVGVANGEKYVSFSTFGSANRQNGGSASQVLHIDKEAAVKIVEILTKEFSL